MARRSQLIGFQRGRKHTTGLGETELRSFFKIFTRSSPVEGKESGRISSPFDNVQVERNDLKLSDLDIVLVEETGRKGTSLFHNVRVKCKNLAEHRMLRGAAGRLNQMLAATRSFFW